MSEAGRNLRPRNKPGTAAPASSNPTPSSGLTTSAETNTWSKGTGGNPDEERVVSDSESVEFDHTVRSREGTLVGQPIASKSRAAPAKGSRAASAKGSRAASAKGSCAASQRDSKLAVLMAELEVRKAALVVAQRQNETAQIKLQIAQCEAQSDCASVSSAAHERTKSWVERQARHTELAKTENVIPAPTSKIEVKPERPKPYGSHFAPIVHKPPELPSFDGNVTEWIAFRAEFNDTSPMFSDVNNVSRIRRALKGDARTAVKSIMYTVQDPRVIMDALERQFGDPDEIVLTELHSVKRMPRLAEDNSNIASFAAHVANAVATIKSLGQDKYLHAPELVNKIVDKLSLIVRYEWSKYRRANPSSPDLVAVSEFLNEISIAAKRIIRKPTHKLRTAVHTVLYEHEPRASGRRAPEYTRDISTGSEESRDARPRTYDRKSHAKVNPPIVAQVKHREHKKKPVVASSKPKTYNSTPVAQSHACAICASSEHKNVSCPKLIAASVAERWELVRSSKLCFRCLDLTHRRPVKCKYVACGVNQCEAGHHKLLHGLSAVAPANGSNRTGAINTISCAHTYLKVIPVEVSGPLGTVQTLALLDEGAEMTLILHETADKIAPRVRGQPLDITGVGGVVSDQDSYTMQVAIRGFCSRHMEIMEAVTISTFGVGVQCVPRSTVDKCDHLKEIADELWYPPAKPTILIGQDNWHLIITRQIISGPPHLPVASLTRLGWVLHGPDKTTRAAVHFVGHARPKTADDEAVELMKQHFDIEALGVSKQLPRADPDQRALDILRATCEKIPGENRYRAGLLWRSDDETLPDNRAQALKRLYSLERKLDRDANLKAEYSKHMNNLLEKGYAEKMDSPPPPDSPRAWYLAHFPVFHPQRGKMRLVWDAAAMAYGRSLNSALLAGPDLLESLFGVLVRFREGKIAVIADVKEMFLQIEIVEQDRDALRFVFRGEDRDGPPQEYRMKRLIFGSASSPTTALYVKNENAKEHSAEFPIAAEKTIKNTYMDDMLIALDMSEQEARRVVNDIYELNMRASFELRGFASNHPEVIADVVNSKEETTVIGASDSERTLGLKWNHKRDTLGFNVNFRNTPENVLDGRELPTKRQVTSSAMSIFDPIGYISPISVLGKALMQEIWRTGIGWDTPIPVTLAPAWRSFIENVQQLKQLEIPRHVPAYNREAHMHVFCDASEKYTPRPCIWLA
ncbi:uncharacterized protein LOC125234904 [Leguminivora glycinivorella]|uniref:uncharacterized protein LOC125234904 n=1 Tax=Leguminivora glycinivorella TaxID=1035111 RepID=UPI002010C71F|nr:uncharacterized protein LOC125234904 [Leguminivora glycinivorella]